MTDNEFVEKLSRLPNKKAKLIKCKSNRAIVEIYVDDSIVPKYCLKFTTIHRARVLLSVIGIYEYTECWKNELINNVKYQTIFDKE